MLHGVVTVETEKGIPEEELEACVAVSTYEDTAVDPMSGINQFKVKETDSEHMDVSKSVNQSSKKARDVF